MRLGVAATPEVALPTLNWIKTSGHTLVRVISQPDKPSGRGQEMNSLPVNQWAKLNSIELVNPTTVGDINSALLDLDLLITIGYGRILPRATLWIPKFGCINLHFSLLPKYRGAAPVQRAIQAGETESGVTVFALDPGMDTGPIYSSITVPIPPTMRSYELLEQLSVVGVEAVKDALIAIESGVAPVPQTGEASMAAKINREEAKLDWNSTAHALINKIRAFYPQPQAWTIFRGQPLKISLAKISESDLILQPGELRVVGNECCIGTNDAVLVLQRLTPAGKKEISALDWSRGARFESSERCG
jgi:methionyl-tRNA formyltransferase